MVEDGHSPFTLWEHRALLLRQAAQADEVPYLAERGEMPTT